MTTTPSTEELELEANRIAARRADPRTPAVVRRAVVRPGAMTLRKFLALEDVASPVLSGQWPWDDAAALAQAFCTAHEIIYPGQSIPGPETVAQTIEKMAAEVRQGFSTVMAMKFPTAPGTTPAPVPHDGIGWVPRIWARIGGHPAQLDMPLEQIFILSAALYANEGAHCAGEDYSDRNIDDESATVIGNRAESENAEGRTDEAEHANEKE